MIWNLNHSDLPKRLRALSGGSFTEPVGAKPARFCRKVVGRLNSKHVSTGDIFFIRPQVSVPPFKRRLMHAGMSNPTDERLCAYVGGLLGTFNSFLNEGFWTAPHYSGQNQLSSCLSIESAFFLLCRA